LVKVHHPGGIGVTEANGALQQQPGRGVAQGVARVKGSPQSSGASGSWAWA